MGAFGKKLRTRSDGAVMFHCPGCGEAHAVSVNSGIPGHNWTFNGNGDAPTFKPSVLVTCGHYVHGFDKGSCWCTHNAEMVAKGEEPTPFECFVCHSFVTDGRIQFLTDCTHALAGQTVDLPDYPVHDDAEA